MRALAALLLIAAAPDPRAELTLTEARAQATGVAVARLTARIAAQEERAAGLSRSVAMLDADLRARQTALARQQAAVLPGLAALESLSRRPPALLLADPARATDAVHTRLALDAMLPDVQARTVRLRADLAATRRLRARLGAEQRALDASRARLDRDARALTRLGSDLAARATGLHDLLDGLGTAGRAGLRLPLVAPFAGKVVTGFGEINRLGLRATGMTFAAPAGAPALSPAAGRVAFAGVFRTYGPIVIVEHGGGVVSLIAGLARIGVRAGQPVAPSQPIGAAGADPYLEVRAGGRSIDPRPWFTSVQRRPS